MGGGDVGMWESETKFYKAVYPHISINWQIMCTKACTKKLILLP